jgi:hypothetical protein
MFNVIAIARTQNPPCGRKNGHRHDFLILNLEWESTESIESRVRYPDLGPSVEAGVPYQGTRYPGTIPYVRYRTLTLELTQATQIKARTDESEKIEQVKVLGLVGYSK